MDLEKHKQDMLAHLVWMAGMPAAKAHAWHRVQEMARECPELYGDLPNKLTEAIAAAIPMPGSPSASGSSLPTKEAAGTPARSRKR